MQFLPLWYNALIRVKGADVVDWMLSGHDDDSDVWQWIQAQVDDVVGENAICARIPVRVVLLTLNDALASNILDPNESYLTITNRCVVLLSVAAALMKYCVTNRFHVVLPDFIDAMNANIRERMSLDGDDDGRSHLDVAVSLCVCRCCAMMNDVVKTTASANLMRVLDGKINELLLCVMELTVRHASWPCTGDVIVHTAIRTITVCRVFDIIMV